MRLSRLLTGIGVAGAIAAAATPAWAPIFMNYEQGAQASLRLPSVNQSKPIEIESFQWGVGRGISSPTGGSADRESSAPSVSEIVITKAVDKASPGFFRSLSGRHFGNATLFMRKAGGEQLEYELHDVM